MSSAMQQIEIPVDHFFRAASKSYNNWITAVIREFHQNCTDAGATRIDYDFSEEDLTLTVIDNGSGCTSEDIKYKLLTLGGSGKVSGETTGGFGIAKEILYFPWQEWSIRTRDVLVKGSGSKFHEPVKVRGEEFRGFKATIKFPELSILQNMRMRAHTYLQRCEVFTDTYIDGNKIENTVFCGRLARTMSWCNIFVSSDEDKTDCYAYIRVNGILMFTHYVGDDCPRVIVEITVPSINVLTSNRDEFRSTDDKDYRREFHEFAHALIIDKKQSVRDNIEHTETIRGAEGEIIVDDPFLSAKDNVSGARLVAEEAGARLVKALENAAQKAEDVWCKGDVELLIEAVKNGFTDAKKAADSSVDSTVAWVAGNIEIASFFLEEAEKENDDDIYKAADILRLLGTFPDVVVMWRGDDKKSVQKVLDLKSVQIIIKCWAEFLKIIMLYSGNFGKFKVGVGINLDGVEALYYKEGSTHVFLVDPTIDTNGNPGKLKISDRYFIDELMERAIHEVCHVRYKYHDVTFCCEMDRIHRALRPHYSKFKAVVDMVKTTTPKRSDN